MDRYEITIGDSVYEIDAPDEASLRKAVQRLQIGRMGEENARRLAPAPRNPMDAGSVHAGGIGGGSGMLIPIPTSSPQEAAEIQRGLSAGSGTAAVTGAFIAAPVAAAKMAGSAATGFVVGEGTQMGLEKLGVNRTVADYAGTGVSMAIPGGAGVAALTRGALGKGLKGRVLAWLAKFGKGEVKEVAEKIVVASEREMLLAKALLRQSGKTVKEIDDLVVMEGSKAAAPVVAKVTAPRTLDPLKGVDFNKAGGKKAKIAAVEAKAQYEGRGFVPGVGERAQGAFEPVKVAAKKAVKKVASPGAVRAGEHKALVAFGKQEAKGHKFGEKVWIELDKAGEPVRVMTPGQASHVIDSLKTWIKKSWRD